jgi:hypothetical protein
MKPILTVLEHAESQDLTTLETVREELGITDNAQDGRLRRLIAEASADIVNWCRRPLREERVKEEFRFGPRVQWGWSDSWRYRHRNEPFNERLVLQRKPVAMIDTLTVDGADAAPDVDYSLDARDGVVTRLSSNCPIVWNGVVSVIYVGGFRLGPSLQSEGVSSEGGSGAISGGAMASTSYPLDPSVERACLILVASYFKTKARDPAERIVEVPGVLSRTYFDPVQLQQSGLPKEVTDRLAPYRRLFE